MNYELDKVIAASHIMHEILNNVSSIMSISQLAIINHRDMPPELEGEMKRIVETSHQLSANIRTLADVLDEED